MLNEETSSPYNVQEFQHNPGIYFEKLGRLHYARETWKLVIKLDLTALTARYSQIMRYLQKAKITCAESQTQACGRIELVTRREVQYLKGMITQIRTIYKPPTNRRRGLRRNRLVSKIIVRDNGRERREINQGAVRITPK